MYIFMVTSLCNGNLDTTSPTASQTRHEICIRVYVMYFLCLRGQSQLCPSGLLCVFWMQTHFSECGTDNQRETCHTHTDRGIFSLQNRVYAFNINILSSQLTQFPPDFYDFIYRTVCRHLTVAVYFIFPVHSIPTKYSHLLLQNSVYAFNKLHFVNLPSQLTHFPPHFYIFHSKTLHILRVTIHCLLNCISTILVTSGPLSNNPWQHMTLICCTAIIF